MPLVAAPEEEARHNPDESPTPSGLVKSETVSCGEMCDKLMGCMGDGGDCLF